MKEQTIGAPAAERTEDYEDQLRERARRLCRQTLRNQDAGEAFATLLLALGELADDGAFRSRPELARRAAMEAVEIIGRVERELG